MAIKFNLKGVLHVKKELLYNVYKRYTEETERQITELESELKTLKNKSARFIKLARIKFLKNHLIELNIQKDSFYRLEIEPPTDKLCDLLSNLDIFYIFSGDEILVGEEPHQLKFSEEILAEDYDKIINLIELAHKYELI